MKRDKLPYLHFYPGDWTKDPGVQALGFFERGVWFEIILMMHESTERGALLLNHKPMPQDALAKLLGLDNQTLTKTISTLIDYGVASFREDGALINRRMIRDEEVRKTRKECGSKGGNPALLKQKEEKGKKEVKQECNQMHDTDTVIDTDIPKKENDKVLQNSEIRKIEPVFETEAEREIYQAAENALEKDSGQPWTRENSFMLAGRRPLKNYPLIRLTASGFANVIKTHETNGLGAEDTKESLRKVQLRLQSLIEKNQKIDYANAESWLVGWAMIEQLEKKINVNRLTRSEQVLNGKAKYAK